MTHAITCAALSAVSLIVSAGAFAGSSTVRPSGATHPSLTTQAATRTAQPATLGPAHTGQPNQSCGSATAPSTPGNSAAAPGSAFNPDGKSGTVYAGEQPQNSRNTASVSQYDVACFHQR
jgi:hypothetical protein